MHGGAGVERESGQAGVEPGRMDGAGALEHDTGVELGRADLGAQPVAGDEAHRLAQLTAVLVRLGREPGDLREVVREVQLPGAHVVAVDPLVGHERLDQVEGVVDLVVHAAPEGAVPVRQAGRSGLQLGDDHPAVARAGPRAEGVPIDHHHRPPGAGQPAAADSPQ